MLLANISTHTIVGAPKEVSAANAHVVNILVSQMLPRARAALLVSTNSTQDATHAKPAMLAATVPMSEELIPVLHAAAANSVLVILRVLSAAKVRIKDARDRKFALRAAVASSTRS